MTDTHDAPWPATAFARELQAASTDAMERQTDLFRRLLAPGDGLRGLDALSSRTATFKTRVQSGGRISIPDAEREALDIHEGDIVQAVVLPLRDRGGDDA